MPAVRQATPGGLTAHRQLAAWMPSERRSGHVSRPENASAVVVSECRGAQVCRARPSVAQARSRRVSDARNRRKAETKETSVAQAVVRTHGDCPLFPCAFLISGHTGRFRHAATMAPRLL